LKETNCKVCQDSGWVLVKVKEREIARPCQCRRNDVRLLKVDHANIPLRFVGTELKSYFPDKENPSQGRAKKLSAKFIADYPAVSNGLLFHGATGVGKTRLLCCIGNQLIKDKDCEVIYIDWNDLAREMKSGEDAASRDFANISQLIQRLARVELLLFDELGASRPSPWVEDNIYYLINRRYNDNRVTVFASNFFDSKIGSEETLSERIGIRIRSRLFEMASSVEIKGADYRHKYYHTEEQ
jgi:DNA replication protein DnaC